MRPPNPGRTSYQRTAFEAPGAAAGIRVTLDTHITFGQMPRGLRIAYVSGATMLLLSAYAIAYGSSYCFEPIQLSSGTDVGNLDPPFGIYRGGYAAFAALAYSLVCYFSVSRWIVHEVKRGLPADAPSLPAMPQRQVAEVSV